MSDLVSAAAPGIGGGIGVWAVFKFIRWLVEFVFKRLDVSRGHLGQRLKHVEAELDAYREATMLMMSVLARLDPENSALKRVARMLRTIAPRSTMELDELETRLKEVD